MGGRMICTGFAIGIVLRTCPSGGPSYCGAFSVILMSCYSLETWVIKEEEEEEEEQRKPDN